MPATILVADDQEFVRNTLCSLLREQPGWRVYEAENGKVALEQIREVRPDVAVLDIVMPEMGGIEAAREIRQHAPHTKVILISSHYTPEEAAMLARLFADGNFIQKSEAGEQLVPAISRLLPRVMRRNYDLFRCVQGQAFRLETLTDFREAVDRMNSHALNEPGEYDVLDQEAFQIVATTEPSMPTDSNRRTSRPLPKKRQAH
jgi:DNA-binding NarL/FixJ family response regulator